MKSAIIQGGWPNANRRSAQGRRSSSWLVETGSVVAMTTLPTS
jgi:hypothetical protein